MKAFAYIRKIEKTYDSWYCGYVAVSPYAKINEDVIDDVHGGCTYTSNNFDTELMIIPVTRMPDPQNSKTFRIYGFDCAHAGDTTAQWDYEAVKRETLNWMHKLVCTE